MFPRSFIFMFFFIFDKDLKTSHIKKVTVYDERKIRYYSEVVMLHVTVIYRLFCFGVNLSNLQILLFLGKHPN